MAYARIAPIYNVAIMVSDAVHAVAYRAYAIRPYNSRKTNLAKNTFDVRKTT